MSTTSRESISVSTMAFNPRHYETVYGFEMLDNIHNFFPELIYDETMFNDDYHAWMRFRMQALFPIVYIRQHNMYDIYHSRDRRSQYEQWRRSRLLTAHHPTTPATPATTPATPTTPVTTPATPTSTPSTPLVIPLPRVMGLSLAPALSIGRTSSPVTPHAPIQRHEEPVRRMRMRQSIPPVVANPMEDLLNRILMTSVSADTAIEANLLSIFTNSITPANLWEDIEVVPTSTQIETGSIILETSGVPSDTVCAICQERSITMTWRKLNCEHYFHKSCIDTWFGHNVKCPVCRTDVRNRADTPTECDTESIE